MSHKITEDDISDKKTIYYDFRRMRESDIEKLVEMEKTTWGNMSWPVEEFLKYLSDPLANCWIIESSNDDCLGFGIQSISKGIAHITNLCIHPNHRGCGLGKILLRFMLDYARSLYCTMVKLEVLTTNSRAIKMYYDHGFEIVEHHREYYPDYSDAYLMLLTL